MHLHTRFISATALLALLLGRPVVGYQKPVREEVPTGVVVEEVGQDGSGEKARVRAGEVLLSWIRPASLPANPKAAQGEFRSPFDFREVEIEQAPRGQVRLYGTREGKRISFTVPPGTWTIKVRPQMPQGVLSVYQVGTELIAAKDIDKGVALWREAAEEPKKGKDSRLVGWLFLRMGDALAEAGKWDEAHVAYGKAIQEAEGAGEAAPLAMAWDSEGKVFQKQNDFGAAREAYTEALKIQEEISPESLSLANSLHSLGGVAWRRGELAAAEEFHQR